MPTHRVPFSSQYADIGRHDWRARGCGIASLHMVLAYWHSVDARFALPTLDSLLDRGRDLGAYREGIGWSHAGLVELARVFGYDGYNADFAAKSPTPKTPVGAWAELMRVLRNGPVMASMHAGLDPSRSGGHIVVVTGVHDGLVFFNDPEEMTGREGVRILAEETFRCGFKLRYIVIRPPDRLRE